jgi:aspartate 1-decarboxylase
VEDGKIARILHTSRYKMRFLLFVSFILLFSCSTNSNLSYNGSGTTDIRNGISEQQSIQAESSISGARVEAGIINAETTADRIQNRINEIEYATNNRETDDAEVINIFERVRDRQIATTGPDTRTDEYNKPP